jgi:hypothetical protein
MSLLKGKASKLGKGSLHPAGSVADEELAATLSGYRRTVASRYRAVMPDELAEALPKGSLHVSPKIDGELWYLVKRAKEIVLVSPNGRAISGDIPVLAGAKASFATTAGEDTVLAGELFAEAASGRSRISDLAAALGNGAKADVGLLRFSAFDVVCGGDDETPQPGEAYEERLATLQRLLENGGAAGVVKSEVATDHSQVQQHFDAWVGGDEAEGLVIRAGDGRIFKLKPVLSLDAVIIGFTERSETDDQVGSILLALMREDGQYQLIGACGNVGGESERADLYKKISKSVVDSSFRYASGGGALYRFVKPEQVVEVATTDVQSEDSEGRPIKRMVLEYADSWSPVRPMESVSLIHPRLIRLRDDKEVNATDIRAAQLEERCLVADLHETAEPLTLAPSSVLRREVYAKTTKGEMAVRKILVWKTEKEEVDPAFPAFVVHFTDYSPGRKAPMKREVRLAPSQSAAFAIADDLVESNIKKGWEAVDQAAGTPKPAAAKDGKKPAKKKKAAKKPAKKVTASKEPSKKSAAKKTTKKKSAKKKAPGKK